MNATGIGVFYGAYDIDTAIAEIRPNVGDTVGIAQFVPSEPLHVLDLTICEGVGPKLNLFSQNYSRKTSQWEFLRKFTKQISQPYHSDQVSLEYIPTQAVFEFLTSQLVDWSSAKAKVRGLIFASAQNSRAPNIAIREKISSEVEPPNFLSMEDGDLVQDPNHAFGLEYVPDSFKYGTVSAASYQTTNMMTPGEWEYLELQHDWEPNE
jgi:hypothetical protein